jgi:cell division protein FtsA
MGEDNVRYAALEITSKTVKLVYGYVQDGQVFVLHALESNVQALDGGRIVESDALTAAIKGVISTANENLNIHLTEVLLAVPPLGLTLYTERAMTNTISPDNHVAQIDINNCITQLKKIKVSDGVKIIDVVPIQYSLDNNDIISEAPLGRKSSSLSVSATIYGMDADFVNAYIKVVENCGVKVKQVVSAPFATALYLLDSEQVVSSSSSYYLLNIGSNITTLNQIQNRSIVTQSKCWRFGGDNISEKLSEKFNISFKDAQSLKEKYGIDKSPSFKVHVFNDLTLDDIGECIQEVILPIINSIKGQISNWSGNDNRYLPVVLTGGGTKLNGLKDLLEEQLKLTIIDVTPYSFGARDKSYENCLGLIKYANKYIQTESDDPFVATSISRVAPREGKRIDSQDYNINEEL